jgi:predicted PurR-regulated permease PerM
VSKIPAGEDDMVKFPFYARLALTLLAVVLVFYIMHIGSRIFIPLVFALLISIFLYPVNRFFELKLRMGRIGSALTSVVLFFTVFIVFVYFLILQILNFTRDFPALRARFHEIFTNFQHWLSYKFQIDSKLQTDYINTSLSGFFESAARSAGNMVSSAISVILLLVFIFLFTFFMLYHRRLLMRFVLHVFNVRYRGKVQEVVMETKSMINAYVLGLVIDVVLLSIVHYVMFLIMGVQYALLLGVMASVLNIIPYLGIYMSVVLVMLVTIVNSSVGLASQAVIGLFIVHVLDANILMPKIVGGKVKMNPFITIVAVITGEAVWGVPGMFLFIPLTGILKIICSRVEDLEAWTLLMGEEEMERPKEQIKIDRREGEGVSG